MPVFLSCAQAHIKILVHSKDQCTPFGKRRPNRQRHGEKKKHNNSRKIKMMIVAVLLPLLFFPHLIVCSFLPPPLTLPPQQAVRVFTEFATMWTRRRKILLEQWRKKARLFTVYKYHHRLINIKSKHSPTPAGHPRRITQHTHDLSYDISSHRTAYRPQTFFQRTIQEWKGLPLEVITASTPGSFETRVCSFLKL